MNPLSLWYVHAGCTWILISRNLSSGEDLLQFSMHVLHRGFYDGLWDGQQDAMSNLRMALLRQLPHDSSLFLLLSMQEFLFEWMDQVLLRDISVLYLFWVWNVPREARIVRLYNERASWRRIKCLSVGCMCIECKAWKIEHESVKAEGKTRDRFKSRVCVYVTHLPFSASTYTHSSLSCLHPTTTSNS